MTVLVTGAAGFFGSAIVRALTLAGHDVLGFDRTPEERAQRRPDVAGPRVRYAVGDVTDASSLDPARFDGVTGIVHAAAVSLPDEARMVETILDVNVRGTINVLTLATRLPACERFLLISSAGVYDLARPGHVREADATGGHSVYGATKMASEALSLGVGAVARLDVGVVRPSSLWGPGEIGRPTRPFVTPLQQLVEHARRGEPVEPRGIHARWDWIYVDDGAEGVARFYMTSMAGRCLTLASGTSIPFGDVVAGVEEVFGLDVRPGGAVVQCSPDRPSRLSIDALVAATGWRPRTTLVDGLRRYRQFLGSTAGSAQEARATDHD